jgi:ribonuclease I
MSKIQDGGAAFPFSAEYGHPAACGGMSLRDYFAGQALAKREIQLPASVQAGEAYAIADAMLKAREEVK